MYNNNIKLIKIFKKKFNRVNNYNKKIKLIAKAFHKVFR